MTESDLEEKPDIQENQLSQEDTTLALERFKELIEEYQKLKEKIKRETVRKDITLNLPELKENIKPGDVVILKVKADFYLNEKPISKSKFVSVEYQNPLPSLPNWYPGDGHMHTDWSDGDDPPQVIFKLRYLNLIITRQVTS